MVKQNRSRIALGVLLVLVGVWFLAREFFPELGLWMEPFTWPMILVGVGVFLFLLGLFTSSPGMAIPAAVVAGIGGILYYQNTTGDWSSWMFAWALIPGFVGVGSIIAGILGDHPRQSIRHGINLIFTSVILFLIFFSIAGRAGNLSTYWPALLIFLGVWLLLRALFSRR